MCNTQVRAFLLLQLLPLPSGGTVLTSGIPFVTGGSLKLGLVSDSSLSPELPRMAYLPFVKSVDGWLRARGWLSGGRKG